MSFSLNYPINGVHFFENAREHMERNDFPRIPIGKVGGIDGWYLTLRRTIVDNEMFYCPFVRTNEIKPKLRHAIYFWFLNSVGKYPKENPCTWGYLLPRNGPLGRGKSMGEWLNEENGWLIDGGIYIEYGLQIRALMSENDTWTFNFYNPQLDCEKKQNFITFHTGTRFFYCHKQLLSHHSTFFDSEFKEKQMIEMTDDYIDCFDYFLQIGHGVRGIEDVNKTRKTVVLAHYGKLPNVTQLLDQTAKINFWYSQNLLSEEIYYGLEHCLAGFLKKQESFEGLAEELNNVDLERMSGESMKKCVKRFLGFEIMGEEPSVSVEDAGFLFDSE